MKPFAIDSVKEADGQDEQCGRSSPSAQSGAIASSSGPLSPELASKAQLLVEIFSKSKQDETEPETLEAAPLANSGVAVKLDVARPLRGSGPEKVPAVEGVYRPGSIQDAKVAYVQEKKKSGMKHREAAQAWMLSNERADLLNNVPADELKRRRFA